MTANDHTKGDGKSPSDSSVRVLCMNCGETFDGREVYQRHMWNDHGGEVDLGEKATGVSA